MPPALKLLWNKSLSCIWVIPLTFHYTHTVRQGRDTSKFGVFLSPGVYRHKEVQDLTASPSVSLKSCLIISVCFRVNVASREISRHGLIATIQIGNQATSHGKQHPLCLHWQLKFHYDSGTRREKMSHSGGHGNLPGPSHTQASCRNLLKALSFRTKSLLCVHLSLLL